MTEWLLAFVATCAIELAVLFILAPRSSRVLPIAFAAQVATHPLVWLAMALVPGPQLLVLCVVELGATLVEAAIYARVLRLSGREAFALSALANAASLLGVAGLASLLAR